MRGTQDLIERANPGGSFQFSPVPNNRCSYSPELFVMIKNTTSETHAYKLGDENAVTTWLNANISLLSAFAHIAHNIDQERGGVNSSVTQSSTIDTTYDKLSAVDVESKSHAK